MNVFFGKSLKTSLSHPCWRYIIHQNQPAVHEDDICHPKHLTNETLPPSPCSLTERSACLRVKEVTHLGEAEKDCRRCISESVWSLFKEISLICNARQPRAEPKSVSFAPRAICPNSKSAASISGYLDASRALNGLLEGFYSQYREFVQNSDGSFELFADCNRNKFAASLTVNPLQSWWIISAFSERVNLLRMLLTVGAELNIIARNMDGCGAGWRRDYTDAFGAWTI